MRKLINASSVLCIAAFLLVSCSKDNDPVDDDIFVGTYNGSVSYSESESETIISTAEGRVTLVKVGDTYNFDFSDGIPSLKGIKMEKNQKVLVNTSGSITIDEGNLTIAYSTDGEIWGADCTR